MRHGREIAMFDEVTKRRGVGWRRELGKRVRQRRLSGRVRRPFNSDVRALMRCDDAGLDGFEPRDRRDPFWPASGACRKPYTSSS